MPIPESQLKTWSHQGSITQSKNTYNTINNVLSAKTTPYANKNFKVFLQGSYGNDTNTYAESDVDIVIRLDDTFYSDLTSLTDEEAAAYKSAFRNATYTHAKFKRDVLSELKKQYGTSIKAGNKAIAIEANGSRRKADVIVANQFRHYFKFHSLSGSEYVKGICFWNGKNEQIVNYPNQHSVNLTTKHQNTSKWLKPMVRVFKNIRSRMIDDGLIKEGIAPSYFLEGLLYNVPTAKFNTSYQECIYNTLNWYRQNASKSDLVCANEQYPLLRDGNNNCWTQVNCDTFIEAAVRLWNEW